MTVNAYDEKGRVFPKNVIVDTTSEYGPIISFGWPWNYYVVHLMYNPPKVGDRICIDAGGGNHMGLGVYIDWTEELISLLTQAQTEEKTK